MAAEFEDQECDGYENEHRPSSHHLILLEVSQHILSDRTLIHYPHLSDHVYEAHQRLLLDRQAYAPAPGILNKSFLKQKVI